MIPEPEDLPVSPQPLLFVFPPEDRRRKEKKMKKKRNLLLAAGFVLLLAALAALYFFVLKPGASPGDKTIHVSIVKSEESSKTVDIQTDAEYLRQALEEQNLISGEESTVGLYVQTVDGLTADEGERQWWCFTKEGEELSTGVDLTPIEDGDRFEITLSTW